jgi:hypothetical protein
VDEFISIKEMTGIHSSLEVIRTPVVRLFFPGILMFILLPMLIDCSNSCVRARVFLALRLKLKLWENFH